MQDYYISIDLKSFYASVECIERGLDPLKTNLVVADNTRTEKTICLAVSPSLKSYGIPGRARLFEVIQRVKEVNSERKYTVLGHKFTGKSYNDDELKAHKDYELDYIIAPPRMNKYMKYSIDIYNIYLKYFSPDDICVYSIDEVFIDVTKYLPTYKMKPSDLATKVIHDVYKQTGITATCGVGTNLYLAKVAMDIAAKHVKPNKFGVRIACLDEQMYKQQLWSHRPITDFWRVGKGIAKKMEQNHMYTMGDIARCSINNEDKLFKLFGINAELLIDHAWGYEPATIEEIKIYKPASNSISIGQVLHCPYNYEKTKLIIREMIDSLALDLVKKEKITKQLTLTIIYDVLNLKEIDYDGEISYDHYGRKIPKYAHGTIKLDYKTSSSKILSQKCIELYEKIINPKLLVKKINIAACDITSELETQIVYKQLDLFNNIKKINENKIEKEQTKEELKLSKTMLKIKEKYGKNSILKAMDLEEGATTIERNEQVGGHKE